MSGRRPAGVVKLGEGVEPAAAIGPVSRWLRHPHLFVYGSLKQTAGHPMGALLRRHATHVGHGTIQARLYLIDDPDDPTGRNFYPGALPSANPADVVHGEVHHVHAAETLYPLLDAYEGCSPDWPEPHDFIPRSMVVSLAGGGSLRATAYMYSWDVTGARHVPSGDFDLFAPQIR